jgi:Na+-driven multidrug efflux pump
MVLLGIVAVVFISNPGIFIRLFTREQNIVDAGAECLRIISYGYLCYALGMVMVQAFNGAGDTATPTWVNLVAFWMAEVPLAYFLAIPAGLDQKGVFIAIVIGESILTIISVILFYRGRWKESIV